MSQNQSSSNSERDTDNVAKADETQTTNVVNEQASSTEQIDTNENATPSNTQEPPAQPPQKGKAKIIGLIIVFILLP